jgi:hypothetical protein
MGECPLMVLYRMSCLAPYRVTVSFDDQSGERLGDGNAAQSGVIVTHVTAALAQDPGEHVTSRRADGTAGIDGQDHRGDFGDGPREPPRLRVVPAGIESWRATTETVTS